MVHDVIIATFQAEKPGQTPHLPKELSAFVGVSSLSTSVSGITVGKLLTDSTWYIINECNFRKIAKIELPNDVHYGWYYIHDVKMKGLYSDYAIRDGMGASVYVYCAPVEVKNGTEKAIDAAINQGIMLSIPQKDGTRRVERAKVVAISDLYTSLIPDNWTPDL